MFGIFDLAYPKIVDLTIFVRKSFIFAGNFLACRAGARRAQFLRPSPPFLSRVAAWSMSSRSDRDNCPRVHHGIQVARKKGGGAQKKGGGARGGVVSRETTATWGVRARQGVQDSRDIKIAKLLCLCKNAKFGPSNAKFAKMYKSNVKLLESNF